MPERAGRDLDAGHLRTVRVAAEATVPAQEALQLRLREEPLPREHGVERHRPVPLGEQEAVALLPRRVLRLHAQDVLVEHVEDVEGGVGGGCVLLVARLERHQPAQLGERLHR